MSHTLVTFHAHPDDESLLTAGVMAKAAAAGHRVVLVVATRGEVGDVGGEFLGTGESLGARRSEEQRLAAEALGVHRLEFLGYADSGHDGGAPRTADATPFSSADLDEAAGRLAAILREEQADVLTSYDRNGGYHHPDHVQVHHVGRRAGELAGTPVVLEATINRDLMRVGLELASSLGVELPPQFSPETFDDWFLPESELTHAVDVSAYLPAKRAAMEAHASQSTGDEGPRTIARFLSLPDEYFAMAFGTEWFVDRDRSGGDVSGDIFAALDSEPTAPR